MIKFTNLDIKNFFDVRVRVKTSIFAKISKLSFDLEIVYKSVVKYKEVSYDEKTVGVMNALIWQIMCT